MPRLIMPDGVPVDFPDDMPPEKIKGMIETKFPDAFKPNRPGGGPHELTVGGDVMDTILPATVRAGTGIAGSLGDVGSLAGWTAEKLGMSPDTLKSVSQAASASPLLRPFTGPGSAELTGKVEEGIGAPLYEPQTTAGRVTEKAIGLAPAAFGGEGSLGMRVLQNVAAPALAGEAGGTLAEKTLGKQFRPVGEFVGMTGAALTPSIMRAAVGAKPVPEHMKRSVETLRAEGIEPTAGQATDSRRLRYFESESGGSAAADIAQRQREELTAAAAEKAGIKANRLLPEVIDQGFTDIGDKFNELGARNEFTVTKNLRNNATAIGQSYRVEPINRSPAVDDTIAAIKKWKVGSKISGETYNNLRSQLATDIRSTNVGVNKKTLGKIIDLLDEAMDSNISAADALEWRKARQQYRNMLVLDKAMSGAGQDIALGYVTPPRLRTAAQSIGKRSFRRGKDDFTELANAAESVLKPLPDSGTPGRTGAQLTGLLTRMATGSLLGTGAGLPAGPFGAGMGAVAGAIAPAVSGKFAMTRPMQQWLQSQLAGAPLLTTGLAGAQVGHKLSKDELWRRALILEQLQRGGQ